VLDVQVAADGTVSDASVVSGPMELRRGTLTSVLGWHFMREAAGRQQVIIEFKAGAPALPRPEGRVLGGVVDGTVGSPPRPEAGVRGGVVGSPVIGGLVQATPSPGRPVRVSIGGAVFNVTRRLVGIDIQGLSPEAAEELRRRLPIKEGETIDTEGFRRVEETVKAFDPHLSSQVVTSVMERRVGPDGQVMPPDRADITIHIHLLPGTTAPPESSVPQRIRVGGVVQQSMLISQVSPTYPQLAKDARISGVVTLNAVIGKDGTVINLSVISGHPLLIPAAMEAVRQWQYRPTLLNGEPVEVVTQIDVNFTLPQ
jgi:TonB family protein